VPPPPPDTRSAAVTAPGACLFVLRLYILPFFVCIPIPHLLTPFPVFSSALCQTHLSGPSSPASRILSCPHLCAQTWIWETLHCPPQDQAFGRLERFRFLINTSPSEGRRVELRAPPRSLAGRLPLRRCHLMGHLVGHTTRRTVPWCTGGRARPLPHRGRKAIMSRDRQGAFGSRGVGGSGIPRVDGA